MDKLNFIESLWIYFQKIPMLKNSFYLLINTISIHNFINNKILKLLQILINTS